MRESIARDLQRTAVSACAARSSSDRSLSRSWSSPPRSCSCAISLAGNVGTGFDLTHTLRVEVNLPPDRYTTPESIQGFCGADVAGLQALPGMSARRGGAYRALHRLDAVRSDITFPDSGEKRDVNFSWNAVTPDFFTTMSIPMLQGRAFTDADRGGDCRGGESRVRRTLSRRAARYRPRLSCGGEMAPTVPDRWAVVGDTKTMTVGEDDVPQLYQPLAQVTNDRRRVQFVLRSVTPPALHVAAVRAAHATSRAGSGHDRRAACLQASGWRFSQARWARRCSARSGC